METTDSGPNATGPARRRRSSARSGLLGAVVGVGAVVGGLTLLTAGAGAQPSVADDTATTAEADSAVVIGGDHELEAELEPYVACVDGVLADSGIDIEAAGDEVDLTEAEWEAIDAAITGCEDHLPEELAAEWAELDEAFAEYDACLVDNGLVDEGDFDEDGEYDVEAMESAAFVLVEDEDGSTAIEFGDGDGSISLTKVDGEISVATDGDVTSETLDWDELEGDVDDESFDDEAFEVCDDILDDIEDLEGDFDFDDHDDVEELEGDQD